MPEVLEFPSQAAAAREPAQLATVAVVGLGYVGLPLAVAFGRERPTVGFDLSEKRVESVRRQYDSTGEVSPAELAHAKHLRASTDPAELARAQYLIVAVPTPITAARQPDFEPLARASETIGRHMQPGATVIPGHGAVAKYDDLVAYIEMLKGVRAKLSDLVRSGATLEQAIAAKPTAEWDARYGDPTRIVNRGYAALQRQNASQRRR